MRKMWNEWAAQWGIMRKKTSRGRRAEAIQEKVVLDRRERDKANHPIYSLFPHPLLSCGTSAFTGGMNLKALDTTIAGSGYRNPASRPRKSCGTWTKRTQHSSAPSPLTNGVCPYAACQQIDKVP